MAPRIAPEERPRRARNDPDEIRASNALTRHRSLVPLPSPAARVHALGRADSRRRVVSALSRGAAFETPSHCQTREPHRRSPAPTPPVHASHTSLQEGSRTRHPARYPPCPVVPYLPQRAPGEHSGRLPASGRRDPSVLVDNDNVRVRLTPRVQAEERGCSLGIVVSRVRPGFGDIRNQCSHRTKEGETGMHLRRVARRPRGNVLLPRPSLPSPATRARGWTLVPSLRGIRIKGMTSASARDTGNRPIGAASNLLDVLACDCCSTGERSCWRVRLRAPNSRNSPEFYSKSSRNVSASRCRVWRLRENWRSPSA